MLTHQDIMVEENSPYKFYHLRSTVKRERFFMHVYFSNETVSQTTAECSLTGKVAVLIGLQPGSFSGVILHRMPHQGRIQEFLKGGLYTIDYFARFLKN